MGKQPMKTYRRIYTIPDIHGRIDLLDLALELIDKDGHDKNQDIIVFLGDYIDRGPNSFEVVDLINKLVESGEALAIRGNHENFAVDYYCGKGGKEIWLMNGGYQTLSSYRDKTGHEKMSDEHIKFLGALPHYLEFQGFFFSHAPVPREKARVGSKGFREPFGEAGEPYNKWELTWHYFGPEGEKKGALMDKHEGPLSQHESGKHLIGLCGHIHRGPNVEEVRIFPNYRMLDVGCGCFPSGPLAIHEAIENRTFYAKPSDLRKKKTSDPTTDKK